MTREEENYSGSQLSRLIIIDGGKSHFVMLSVDDRNGNQGVWPA